ncbi:MAG: TIGR04290 family methyltransferase [Actinomycetota bacterium]|nr:TIGR04290 family methyltransferase [Actinomycetota bacterium]
MHLSRGQLEAEVRRLGEWFHNMDLAGVQTAPGHFLGDYPSVKWQRFAHSIPDDLTGKTVLDIGCNAGFYSIEMKKRGASRVLGIDNDIGYLDQARFAAGVYGLQIEFEEMSVYDIASLDEKFDIVLFMGVFYHLRHPLMALDLIHRHVAREGGLLVFQSMLRGTRDKLLPEGDYPFEEQKIFLAHGFPAMYFVEKKYAGDETNWWIPNKACVEAMLRSSGFDILDNPENEVYICTRKGGAAF